MQQLIFVYNGDSGLVNSVMHLLHKKFSPATYDCQLCMLVYDGVQMNKGWLEFVADLGVPTRYLHRDTFVGEFGSRADGYPALYVQGEQTLTLLVTPAEFQAQQSLEALMSLVGDAARPFARAAQELQHA
ncbi:MAG: hypothetical protein Q7J74_15935 [Pseudomonas sp.]|nr:hypothetical protein [Pseudomonas sp.]